MVLVINLQFTVQKYVTFCGLFYDCQYVNYTASNAGWLMTINRKRFGRQQPWPNRDCICLRETDGNHKNPDRIARYKPRFEPNASRMRVYSITAITATPNRSVKHVPYISYTVSNNILSWNRNAMVTNFVHDIAVPQHQFPNHSPFNTALHKVVPEQHCVCVLVPYNYG
jgi:hypothetical protein